MRNPKHLVLSALLSLSFTAALAGGAVTVTDPYVRAVPPGQPNSAVFMGLVNGTGTPRALVGGHSEVAEVVELHTHTMEDGMMKMRRIERIALPCRCGGGPGAGWPARHAHRPQARPQPRRPN